MKQKCIEKRLFSFNFNAQVYFSMRREVAELKKMRGITFATIFSDAFVKGICEVICHNLDVDWMLLSCSSCHDG